MGLTDTITFTCSACGHTTDFPKAQEGKAIYCPKCQAAQVVKAPGSGSATDRFRAERIPTGRIVKAEAVPGTDRFEKPHGMAGTARIDFVCGACNHTSRISAALSGQPVRCPTCGTVQLAGVAGLRVVRLDSSGKLPFTCSSCNYQVRLNPDYSGKAIRCPKCQGAQVVPRVLRDASGAHQALPSGAAVVRSEPGTGSIRKDAPSGQAQRSEPSPALRTPAGGTTVPQPMPMPTPLPGSLATPPPGSLRVPPPEPTSSASATGLPIVSTDEGQLDLGDSSAPPVADARPRGGVVRRSGRMAAAQRTPQPGDEPTLEAARAVRPEPENDHPPVAPAPAPAATPAPAVVQPQPPQKAQTAWLLPALGVTSVVAIIAAIVLAFMLSAANGRESDRSTEAAGLKKQLETATAEAADTQRKLIDAEASRQLVTSDRDDQRKALEALRREHETLKTEVDRLKAEAAAKPAPVSPPAAGEPGVK